MDILETKIFYSAILLTAVVLMYFSQQQKSPWNCCNIILVLFLGSILGMRHQSVGIDTSTYFDCFLALKNGYNYYTGAIDEPGFLGLSFLVIQMTNSAQAALLLWGFITNALIIIRLHELKKYISLPIAAAVAYIPFFYFFEFNGMRQMIAVAVIFYATRWLESKQYATFFAANTLAVLCHTSAILAFCMVPLALLQNWNRYSFQIKFLLIFSSVIILAGGYFIVLFYLAKYGGYLMPSRQAEAYGIGFFIPVKIAISLFLYFCYIRWKRKQRDILDEDWLLFFNLTCIGYAIGLTGYLASYSIFLADRAVLYFYFLELICFSHWFKAFKKNIILQTLIVVLALFPFVMTLLNPQPTHQGEYPYLFYWHYNE